MYTAFTYSQRPSGYSIFASVIAIILGLIMVLYPGGTMSLMSAALWVLQVIVSIFILAYTISEGLRYINAGSKKTGILYFIIGALATLLVWLFNIEIIIVIIALFFVFAGLSEIIGAFSLTSGRYFMIFLGLINLIVGIMIFRAPSMLPWLIAWYILFWGISRLFLALEMRRRGKKE